MIPNDGVRLRKALRMLAGDDGVYVPDEAVEAISLPLVLEMHHFGSCNLIGE